MKAEGKGSIVYGAAYRNLAHGRAAFINDGTIEVTGESAIGVILPKDSVNSKLANGHLVWLKKSILLKGKKSMGFVAQNTNISNDKNLVKFNIDAEKAIGILQDVEGAGTAKTAGKIAIEGNSSGSMGIYAKQGTLELIAPHANSGETESSIELKAGSNNIGIYAKGASTVNFNGITKITGGEGQKIALATEGSTINLKKAVTAGDKATSNFVKDAVPLYSTGSNSKINVENPDSLKFYLSGNSTAAYAKDKGIINMNRNSLPTEPTIYIKGTNNKGIGLFAKDGGVINAKHNYIKVENGSVGLSSIGENGSDKSNIDFSGGKLEYTGNGYAVYSDGTGTVNLSDAELNLYGSSTAFDVDFNATTLPTILNANTRIHANSDDVIAFNLKNASGLTTVGGIETSIKSKIETKLGLGSGSLNNLFTGSTSTKYKVAAVDGGEITVGNLDKSGKKGDTDQDKIDGYQYFNRFLAQRLKATADGSTIKAVLTTEDATERFNGQVVGFEMNSSKNANGVDDTAINFKKWS